VCADASAGQRRSSSPPKAQAADGEWAVQQVEDFIFLGLRPFVEAVRGFRYSFPVVGRHRPITDGEPQPRRLASSRLVSCRSALGRPSRLPQGALLMQRPAVGRTTAPCLRRSPGGPLNASLRRDSVSPPFGLKQDRNCLRELESRDRVPELDTLTLPPVSRLSTSNPGRLGLSRFIGFGVNWAPPDALQCGGGRLALRGTTLFRGRAAANPGPKDPIKTRPRDRTSAKEDRRGYLQTGSLSGRVGVLVSAVGWNSLSASPLHVPARFSRDQPGYL